MVAQRKALNAALTIDFIFSRYISSLAGKVETFTENIFWKFSRELDISGSGRTRKLWGLNNIVKYFCSWSKRTNKKKDRDKKNVKKN